MTNIDKPTVLIVEDEALIRMVIAEELIDAGYRVLEAANAEEALILLDARPDVRVMITDVRMPGGIDGFSLARLATKTHPGIGIIIASGHADPHEERPAGSFFVRKPYLAVDIYALVDQLLQGQGGPLAETIEPATGPITLVAEPIESSTVDAKLTRDPE